MRKVGKVCDERSTFLKRAQLGKPTWLAFEKARNVSSSPSEKDREDEDDSNDARN